MNTSIFKSKPTVAIVLSIFLLVVLRLVPHWPNWTPILAFAGFTGYALNDRRTSLAVLFVAMLISDAVLGFHAGMIAVYGTLALICILSAKYLKSTAVIQRSLAVTLVSPVLFFLITNLFVWIQDGLYPQTIDGLWMSYVAAIPFLGATFASTALSLAIFEVGYAFSTKKSLVPQKKLN